MRSIRWLAPWVLALALVLMHGGIGSATACAAVPSSTPVITGGDMQVSMSDAPRQHHEPAPPSATAHDHLCASTPPSVAAASPARLVGTPFAAGHAPSSGGVTPTTHRSPPAPDPVRELCVIRT